MWLQFDPFYEQGCSFWKKKNIHYKHTLHTYSTNILYKHIRKTFSTNILYKHIRQTYSTNVICKHTLQTYSTKVFYSLIEQLCLCLHGWDTHTHRLSVTRSHPENQFGVALFKSTLNLVTVERLNLNSVCLMGGAVEL